MHQSFETMPNLFTILWLHTMKTHDGYIIKVIELSSVWINITKTCLYNFDPLNPHIHTVKLEFTGVYISFLNFAQNIDCGYSLEPPCQGGSNEYPQSMFLSRNMKNIRVFI